MLSSTFVKPRYAEGACFAHLPASVIHLLSGEGQAALHPDILGPYDRQFKRVVLFFIDAFGWQYIQRFGDHPFLQAFQRNGRVAQLTSQFPSTTAAHVTCIHTGLPVGQSGVHEWFYYEPQLDAIISPLLFSFAGPMKRDTLKATGIDPRLLYPPQTIYRQLAAAGVGSYVFQHRAYTPSTYSDIVFSGAEVVPYRTLPEALTNLHMLMAQVPAPAYFFLYFANIDTICHDYGPQSPQVEAEVRNFLDTMQALMLPPAQQHWQDTLFMLVADHGQVEVHPESTIYLNRLPELADLADMFKTDQAGKPLVPAGSSRDMFLYIKEAHLTETVVRLQHSLAGHADVVLTADLIAEGYFGPPPPSERFLQRVGNVVILPYAHEMVYWYEKGVFEQFFRGHHGGLTPSEMEIPLLLQAF